MLRNLQPAWRKGTTLASFSLFGWNPKPETIAGFHKQHKGGRPYFRGMVQDNGGFLCLQGNILTQRWSMSKHAAWLMVWTKPTQLRIHVAPSWGYLYARKGLLHRRIPGSQELVLFWDIGHDRWIFLSIHSGSKFLLWLLWQHCSAVILRWSHLFYYKENGCYKAGIWENHFFVLYATGDRAGGDTLELFGCGSA